MFSREREGAIFTCASIPRLHSYQPTKRCFPNCCSPTLAAKKVWCPTVWPRVRRRGE